MSWLLNRNILLKLGAAAVLLAVFMTVNQAYRISLRDSQFLNGWVLVAVMAGMLLLTFRKQLSTLPLGRVRHWLQVHYYLGFLTIGVFLVHTHLRFPNAPLEWLLWILFVLVSASGCVGGFLARIVPVRLEGRGDRVLFERIPVLRAQIADEAETLALASLEDGSSVSLANVYQRELGRFFARPRYVFAHLRQSNLPISRIMGELQSIERYLDGKGKERLERMRQLVRAKNDLDFQYANGGLLKLWLFVHVPPTYALILAILAHVVVAYAFSSGIA
ncbi:hypothetical protein HEP89_26370 [Labrenzia sp. 5N]|uniref:hypothetical protein n=1 Tax=Labrenzia sp. 5N TaxID=2723402 RepID=UPI0014489CEE|nr:hypothetical protein [Labrenzia sp. 5N]NKX67662.1 hypothetical protein [Labrenzia sp. 5N]